MDAGEMRANTPDKNSRRRRARKVLLTGDASSNRCTRFVLSEQIESKR
jgi:hypothetical protein